MTPAHAVYAAALARGDDLVARDDAGRTWSLTIARWLAAASTGEERVLRRARGPVLDVGCGPGRHLRALQRRGVLALGVDPSAAAVCVARRHGVAVLQGSIFGAVPSAGAWRSALLLDGNIGIGGDPVALLMRIGRLLRNDGRILCETDPPGAGLRAGPVRIEHGLLTSEPFAWARVGADALAGVAAAADLRIADRWDDDGRWFVQLERPR